jgi:carbon storage regulator
MLVLSRKVGERIHVGEDIVLEVRRISGNRVTLALEAPRDVRILRGELERAAREFDAPNAAPASRPVTPTPAPATPLNVVGPMPAHAATSDFAV